MKHVPLDFNTFSALGGYALLFIGIRIAIA